ncbi:hypothetical protein, partial [Leyella stercorea]|uniref:hypothetical protein n=1 Tax=Leyella stercorea TaxID=363265 RepID=UPI003A955985
CTCLKCTNVARGISICSVGALETSAPPENSICENPWIPWEVLLSKKCNPWEALPCENPYSK